MTPVVISDNTNPGRLLIPLLLLLLATAALYFPAAEFDYLHYDDQLYVIGDPATKHLSFASLKTIFTEPFFGIWYPLTRLSHLLENVLLGKGASATHLVNVLLHFLNALVLFQVLKRLSALALRGENAVKEAYYPAIFTSLLFVVHPQHLEAVAWAVQRKELLATLFCLLSIKMYLGRRTLAAAGFFMLAMMSKASAVVLPAFFVLLDLALIEPRRPNIRRLARTVWRSRWMLALAVAGAMLTFATHQAESTLFLDEQFTPYTRSVLYANNSLLGLYNFFTFRTGLFHQPISEYIIDVGWPGLAMIALAFSIVVTSCACLWTCGRQLRLIAMGLLFYFAALLPVGGLVVFGNYAFGDRYLYLSSVGIYVALFMGVTAAARGIPAGQTRHWFTALLTILLAASFVQSRVVLPKWRTNETIWLADLERRPDSVFANQQLGSHYFIEGEQEKAVRYFQAAIESSTDPFKVASREASALYLAEISCDRGRTEAAIEVLEKIPGFGGSLDIVVTLLESLRYSGYESCAQAITDWYESRRLLSPGN